MNIINYVSQPRVSAYMAPSEKKALAAYCRKSGHTMAWVVLTAIKEHLKKNGVKI
jgi:hypothetical protein